MGIVTRTIILKSIMTWVLLHVLYTKINYDMGTVTMYYNTKINYDMGPVTCTIILKSIMTWVLLHVL